MNFTKITKLIAITMGLATSISCFAQGGGSVNGPDLKGGMIPVYSDGEIPTEKLNGALDTCYKRMGEQVLGIILGRDVKLGNSSYPIIDTASPDSTPAPIEKNESTRNSYYETSNRLSPDIIIRKDDSISMKPKTNEDYFFAFTLVTNHPVRDWQNETKARDLNITYFFNHYDNSGLGTDLRQIQLVSQFFPFLSYELKDKSIYGELGELIEKHMFVSNIKFNYKPGTTDTTFQLKAIRETDHAEVDSPIKVDSLDLIQCIKSNLAN